jgi:DNA primase
MIAPASVERVLDAARIEDIVGDFVRLRKRGANMLGLCPFHNEKSPSFNVNVTGNYFKCFGCGKGGNSVQFLMEHEQMSFPEAIRYIADKYNITLEEVDASPEQKVEMLHREKLLEIAAYARKHYEQELWETQEGKNIGMSYFKERGFLDTTIKKFQLGYSSKERDSFAKKAKLDGFPEDQLQELGLINKYGYDFFNDRVMFTIHDISGRPVAFAGRILVKAENSPKYINSPESEIYKKSKVLYGLYQARQAIRKMDDCIIVEGYTDVLAMAQSGIEHVVASSGTALTEEQIKLIHRFTQNVTILYDGDPAGIKAALRGLDMVLEQDMNVKIVLLPGKHDPDSFIRESGAEGFLGYLEQNASDFITFKAKTLSEDSKNDPIRKAALIKDVLESISKIPDTIKRSLYLRECASLFDMDETLLVRELNQILKKSIYKEQKKNRPDSRLSLDEEQRQAMEAGQPDRIAFNVLPDTHEIQERDLIRILVAYADQTFDLEDEKHSIAELILSNMEDALDTIDQPIYRKLLEVSIQAMEEGKLIQPEYYLNHEDKELQSLAMDLLISPYEYSENWEKRWQLFLQTQPYPDKNFYNDATQSILRFKLKKFNRKLKENQQKIVESAQKANDEETQLLMQVHQKLLQTRLEITNALRTVIP